MSGGEAAIWEARQTLERSTKIPVKEELREQKAGSIDAIFHVGSASFAVQVKSNARSATVAQAVDQLCDYAKRHPNIGLLLIVPYMGETGAEICERARVSWIDRSGNASVNADHIHVYIRGKRRDKAAETLLQPDLSVNPFSRKASRILHALLIEPKKAWTRAELEMISALDKGYVSKIIAALSEQGYTKQLSSGKPNTFQVVDPVVLIDAWREKYKPERPLSWGLIAALDGLEATRKLADILSDAGVSYAITGLGAAALYTKFGSYRRVDVYIAKVLPETVATRLHAGTDVRGRNVALYLDSANTSIGVTNVERLRLASAVLTYLDLSHLPERSSEAAEEMRRYLEQQWR